MRMEAPFLNETYLIKEKPAEDENGLKSFEILSLETPFNEDIKAALVSEDPINDNDSKDSSDMESYWKEEENCSSEINMNDARHSNQLFNNSQNITVNVLATETFKQDKVLKKEKRTKFSRNLTNITTVISRQMLSTSGLPRGVHFRSTRRPTKASLARKRKIREMFLDVESKMKDGS